MEAAAEQLILSLSESMKELSAARADAAQTGAFLKYAEVTGRLETMRTVISFLRQTTQVNQPQADKTPTGNAKTPKKAS